MHKLTGSLNQMLGRIQKQAQQQNAFFASASHELRTPLSVMLTELQTLQSDVHQTEVKSVIKNQITEVQRLNKIINDFLLMSQLKSDMLVLNKSEVHLPEITIEILERLTAKAQLKHQTFKIELIPEDGEFEIHTDRSHLMTILLNLLENAIKHGQPESIIRIRITEISDKISFIIQNPSQSEINDITMLTNEFRKQDLGSDGFGLGLWIVSRLAETIGAAFEMRYAQPDFTVKLLFIKKDFSAKREPVIPN